MFGGWPPMMYPYPNQQGMSPMDYARAYKEMERQRRRDEAKILKKIKREEDEKKKKESETKKGKSLTTLEMCFLMTIAAPVLGPLYLLAISAIFKLTAKAFLP